MQCFAVAEDAMQAIESKMQKAKQKQAAGAGNINGKSPMAAAAAAAAATSRMKTFYYKVDLGEHVHVMDEIQDILTCTITNEDEGTTNNNNNEELLRKLQKMKPKQK